MTICKKNPFYVIKRKGLRFQNIRTHLNEAIVWYGGSWGTKSSTPLAIIVRVIYQYIQGGFVHSTFAQGKKILSCSLWFCCFLVIQCHTQPTLLFHWCNATLHEIFNPCSLLSIIDGSVWFSFILYQFVFNKHQVLNSSVAGPCFSDMS